MSKPEAEALAEKKNADNDGWKYKAIVLGSKVKGGWAVERCKCEIYRY